MGIAALHPSYVDYVDAAADGSKRTWSAHLGIVGLTSGLAWDDARPACGTPEPGASSRH